MWWSSMWADSVDGWGMKILLCQLGCLWDLAFKLTKLRPRLCRGSNSAMIVDIAGFVLCNWELGNNFVCLEQLNLLSPGLRSYLKGGQWLPAADGKAAAGRFRANGSLPAGGNHYGRNFVQYKLLLVVPRWVKLITFWPVLSHTSFFLHVYIVYL